MRDVGRAKYDFIISTLEPDFAKRFEDWQLQQHRLSRVVQVDIYCVPVTERVEIETIFPTFSGGEEKIGAHVNVIQLEPGNYSNICIGVLSDKYQLFVKEK